MTILSIETIARMIYAVPDISPFTSSMRWESSTTHPLLQCLGAIAREKMLQKSHEVCNDFNVVKPQFFVEPIRIKYIIPALESTPEEDLRLLGEFGKLIFQIGVREFYRQGLNEGVF